jgi:hypothetical protein
VLSSVDSHESIFIDQACKPLVSKLGLTAVNFAQSLSYVDAVLGTSYKDDDESLTPGQRLLRNILLTAGQNFASKFTFDQGQRDGIVLFDKDVYGCKSAVTLRVMKNIMINTRG